MKFRETAHSPRALLFPRLHRQLVLEVPQGIVHGSVVAEQHHLDALEPHDMVGLGPAAVIADAHANEPAESVANSSSLPAATAPPVGSIPVT